MNIKEINYLKTIRYLLLGKLKRPILKSDSNKTLINPYAFIRVKNEAKTMEACLNSISPVIKRGVIGCHKLFPGEEDDGTLNIIKDFIAKNPGYKYVYYPYEVYPPSSEEYSDPNNLPPVEKRLDGFYNFVLENIPKGEWLIKIDCDQIYDTEKLRGILNIRLKENEIISIARMNLHYNNGELFYIDPPNSLVDPVDHWIIYNSNLNFKFKCIKYEGREYGYETLDVTDKKKIYTDLITVHFPFMKNYRINPNIRTIPYDDFKFNKSIEWFYSLDSEFLEKENLINIVKSFNMK